MCVQGKRYNLTDVSAALCMSLGLIWFTLADSKVAPNFNVTGNSFTIHKPGQLSETNSNAVTFAHIELCCAASTLPFC